MRVGLAHVYLPIFHCTGHVASFAILRNKLVIGAANTSWHSFRNQLLIPFEDLLGFKDFSTFSHVAMTLWKSLACHESQAGILALGHSLRRPSSTSLQSVLQVHPPMEHQPYDYHFCPCVAWQCSTVPCCCCLQQFFLEGFSYILRICLSLPCLEHFLSRFAHVMIVSQFGKCRVDFLLGNRRVSFPPRHRSRISRYRWFDMKFDDRIHCRIERRYCLIHRLSNLHEHPNHRINQGFSLGLKSRELETCPRPQTTAIATKLRCALGGKRLNSATMSGFGNYIIQKCWFCQYKWFVSNDDIHMTWSVV